MNPEGNDASFDNPVNGSDGAVQGSPETRVAERVDVTFIGGGPVGLFGACCAGLHSMSAKIIEALPHLGGQPAALYPEKYIYDVPAFPKILAKDLIANLIEQAMQFDPVVCTGERALELRGDVERGFEVVTDRGVHPTRTVICTVGLGAFVPRRLGVPGEERFEGRGVHYFVTRLADFRERRVLIVGGGDSAVDWALALAPLAASVVLVHRRGTFRAQENSVETLFASPVDVRLFHEVRRIEGDDCVRRVVLAENRSGEETTLEVDAVILALGFTPDLGPVSTWGFDLNEDRIRVATTGETSIPGVFAAGDAVDYPGKLKLIAGGFGEVATAVAQAKRYVDPKARLQIHSSNLTFVGKA